MLGIKDDETAKALLGQGGLKTICSTFDREVAKGWDGHEYIGTSSKNLQMTLADAYKVARILAKAIVATKKL